MRFKGKTVVVTGASSGIGRSVAIKFAQEGANVVVCSNINVTGGEAVVAEIESFGQNAIYIQSELSLQEQVRVLFQKAVTSFGTVDILINNAGNTPAVPFMETTLEHWVHVFGNNFFSSVLCAQEAAKIMLPKGQGKILNTSSIYGNEPSGNPVAIAYSSAKAALNSFTRTLAKELAPHIQVNAVAPGFVYTQHYESMSQETKEKLVKSTLIQRFIGVDEVADAFLFLAGADAITGEILMVDGGFTLKSA
jgi:3-oxoacyl-[acyl-carrier protein] reductase